jgi:hypothetical protein
VAFTASAGMDVNCILLEHVAAAIAGKENHDFSKWHEDYEVGKSILL